MNHLTPDRFIRTLYRADFDPLDYTINPYLDYVKDHMSQEFIDNLLLETVKLEVQASVYTENVLAILAFTDLRSVKVDVSIFKTLVKKTNACVVDACLRFIEHQPELFYRDFVQSLDIKVKWLQEYRDSIVEDYKYDFKRAI